MNNDNYDFRDFIGKGSLSTLGSCATIVGISTQLFKQFIDIHPLAICFVCSFALSLVKLILSDDYSKNNVLLAIINVIPMALTAAGGYDLLSKIS